MFRNSGISQRKENMLNRMILMASFLISAQSFAWSAISLGGGNWAIICANGSAWSYSGSSAGLDVVGPALCPGGLIAPSMPAGTRVCAGLAPTINLNIVKNRQETTEDSVQKVKTYPPNGYPCLGCAPCPGNPTEFCDIVSSRIVVVNQSTGRPFPEPLPIPSEL
jgi:hypothetical protein